jgi:spermidine/putrescine transport system permease protein
MHDRLYEHQRALDDAHLEQYAREVGLDVERFDRALEEASADLYANEWRTFWYVTLPTIRSAVLGAALLVFTLSLDEIAVTFFLIGRQNTLPLQIWGLLRRGITPEVNAAATVIFVLSLIVIVLWSRLVDEARSPS